MSHFTVLVPADNEEQLGKLLMPYHEYECTGIEEYLEFVPADMEELQADYEKHGDGRDLDEFADDWGGYEKNEQGIYGRLTNPNARWDWWVIGGRWTGFFPLKDFEAMKYAGSGSPGLMTKPNTSPTHADFARSGDIDWQEMQSTESKRILEKYVAYHGLKERDNNGEEVSHSEYWEAGCGMLRNDEKDDLDTLTRSQYVEKYGKVYAATFAFIDLQGKWNERGKMGWFACYGDENADYDEQFWNFISSLPDEQRVYVVDCHI